MTQTKRPPLSVVYRRTEELIPYVRNARTHSEDQIAQIAGSIREFGFNNPILTDGENGVIAGHGRLLDARKLGMDSVPCIELSGLSETQKRAYILADNKIALNAGWDAELLKVELEEITDGGIDLEIMGFTHDELLALQWPEARGSAAEEIGELEELREKYTTKTDTPIYEPLGVDVSFGNMYKEKKTAALVERINASSVSEEEKAFLLEAAHRHTVFNYQNIAEYYCTKASPEMQKLMEDSALVIIDFNKAVEDGYIILEDKMRRLLPDDDDE